MHSIFLFVYVALLFFLLTPGVVLSLPPGGKKFVVAGVHAVVFALVLCLTYRPVKRFGQSVGLVPRGHHN